MYHQIMTTIIWVHIHDVIHDVTKSQNRSNFEIDISPSIFQIQRRSMLMAIFLVYSTSVIASAKKSLSGSKWRPFWKFWNIKHRFNLTSDMKRSSQIMPKSILMMVMSSMTSQGGLKVGPIYSFNNNIFMITKQWANISSLNFLCICIMRL